MYLACQDEFEEIQMRGYRRRMLCRLYLPVPLRVPGVVEYRHVFCTGLVSQLRKSLSRRLENSQQWQSNPGIRPTENNCLWA